MMRRVCTCGTAAAAVTTSAKGVRRLAKGAAMATMAGSEKSLSKAQPPRRVLLTNDDGPKSPFFEPFVKHVAEKMKWECMSDLI